MTDPHHSGPATPSVDQGGASSQDGPLAETGPAQETRPGVRCLQATAERTGLPVRSVDAIAVGQAWHWMDAEAASTEAARILQPGGTLAMVEPAVQYGLHDPEARVGADLVTEDDQARPPFGPREVFATTWSRTVTAADHLALYTTHSPFLVADAAEQGRRLLRWAELLGELEAPVVVQRYVTQAWRFRLHG